MKKKVNIIIHEECTTLITDIPYKLEHSWFGMSYQAMKLDLLLPKYFALCDVLKPMPLLVWICGGGFSEVDKEIWLPEMVYYVKKGFIVASVEYRTTNEASFPAQLIDVKAAIRFLRANAGKYNIDKDHVFVMGESAGGTLASLVGTTGNTDEFDVGDYLDESSAVNGVIDIHGIVDITRNLRDVPENGIFHIDPMDAFLAGEGYGGNLAKKASAIGYLSKVAPPFLILHGTDDKLVDVEQSRTMYDAMEKLGLSCNYYEFEGAGHGADEFYQQEVKDIVIDFMRTIMNGR